MEDINDMRYSYYCDHGCCRWYIVALIYLFLLSGRTQGIEKERQTTTNRMIKHESGLVETTTTSRFQQHSMLRLLFSPTSRNRNQDTSCLCNNKQEESMTEETTHSDSLVTTSFRTTTTKTERNTAATRQHHCRRPCRRRRPQGTVLSFQEPTQQSRVSDWFGTAENVEHGSMIEFNHAHVGMTHPIHPLVTWGVHVVGANNKNKTATLHHTDGTTAATTTLSLGERILHHRLHRQRRRGNMKLLVWWPPGPSRKLESSGTFARLIPSSLSSSLSSTPSSPSSLSSSNSSSTTNTTTSWRVLCYRQRVGYGWDCYQRVKDAALRLEFVDARGSKGIVAVATDKTPTTNDVALEEELSSGVFQSFLPWQPKKHGFHSRQNDGSNSNSSSSSSATMIRHNGNTGLGFGLDSKRFASFTRIGPPPFGPSWLRFYAVSPIARVYVLEDQYCPAGNHPNLNNDHHHQDNNNNAAKNKCLYSSTAFATLKGHWISGEERVTVILRPQQQRQEQRRRQRLGGSVDVEILSISKAGSDTIWGKLAWPFVWPMQSAFFVQQLNVLKCVAQSLDQKFNS